MNLSYLTGRLVKSGPTNVGRVIILIIVNIATSLLEIGYNPPFPTFLLSFLAWANVSQQGSYTPSEGSYQS